MAVIIRVGVIDYVFPLLYCLAVIDYVVEDTVFFSEFVVSVTQLLYSSVVMVMFVIG